MKLSLKSTTAALASLFILFCTTLAASAQSAPSSVRLEVSVATPLIEAELNREVPSLLKVVKKRNMLCVERTRARCDVDGTATRAGRIKVRAQGKNMRIDIPINVRTTVRGIGAIGKHIKREVEFSIVAFMYADLSISSDWQPVLNLSSKFAWSKPPEIKVMRIVRIDLARQLEPVVASELVKRQRKLQRSLQKYDLRERIAKAWLELQEPVSVSGNPALSLSFRPTSVGLSDIKYTKSVTSFQIGIEGDASVSSAASEKDPEFVQLLPLQVLPEKPSRFSLDLPVSLGFNEIEARIRERLPLEIKGDGETGEFDGTLVIEDVRMQPASNEKLAFDVDYSLDTRSRFLSFIDIFDWFKTNGTIAFSATPHFFNDTSVLAFQDIDIASKTASGLIGSAVASVGVPMLKSRIGDSFTFDIAERVDAVTKRVNTALNRELENGLQLAGELTDLNIANFTVADDALSITIQASGEAVFRIGLD